MFLSKHRLNIASLRIGKHRIVKNIASLRKVNIAHPYFLQNRFLHGMAWHGMLMLMLLFHHHPPPQTRPGPSLDPTKLIESHHPYLGEKADLASEDILSCGGPDTISNTNTNTAPHPHLGEKADLCSDDV